QLYVEQISARLPQKIFGWKIRSPVARVAFDGDRASCKTPEHGGEWPPKLASSCVERPRIIPSLHGNQHRLRFDDVIIQSVDVSPDIVHPPRVHLTKPFRQLRIVQLRTRYVRVFQNCGDLFFAEFLNGFDRCPSCDKRTSARVISQDLLAPCLKV